MYRSPPSCWSVPADRCAQAKAGRGKSGLIVLNGDRAMRWRVVYYEVAKGSLYATAVRCLDCRNKIKHEKELQRRQMAESGLSLCALRWWQRHTFSISGFCDRGYVNSIFITHYLLVAEIMTPDVTTILGHLLILAICVWAVWFLTTQLGSNLDSGTAVDRTLSEVDKDDAPTMFWLQVMGFLILICASIGIGMGMIGFFVRWIAGEP